MWQQIQAQFMPTQLIATAVQSIVMMLALRLLMYAWGTKPPREWLFTGGVFVACFLILAVIGAVLGTDKVPNFNANIAALAQGETKGMETASPSKEAKKMTIVLLVMDISNIGAPSIAKDYQLSVTFNDGTVKPGRLISILNDLTLMHPNGAPEVVHVDDFLLRKTLQPIPRGGLVQGRLIFIIPGVDLSDLRIIGTKYTVTFSDLWGRSYKADIKYINNEDVYLDFAGMRPQVVPIPDSLKQP